jgi:hypothetical protein
MNDHGYVPFVVVIVESSILCGNAWFNYDYYKRNISMIIHYHTKYFVQSWLRQTKHIHDHSLPDIILGSNMTTTNGTYPHGYVALVVVIVEPSILCGNEWSWICFLCRSHGWTKYSVWNYDYDKRNISMIIHYHTEYLVQPWLPKRKHIHDHSFVVIIVEPSIMFGNEWSWICCVSRSHSWTKYSVW